MMLEDNIAQLIKNHNINLAEENVHFAFKDGFVTVTLENGHLDIKVETIDKVIVIDESIDVLFED
ncbi:hypothetical protein [Bacillus smithii]|uniref:hypothetical protein n=1 Tax=Bacillus smithii TaxID=1479 RepID=UPI002E22A7E8|nr:hypothetical protein [Bacillus smithii]MED1456627.1 hypothetical protein [Bacillus smithii]